MHSSAIVTSTIAFVALTTAAPASKRNVQGYFGCNLNFNTASGLSNTTNIVGYPIEIGELTTFDISASSIAIDDGVNSQLDLNTIECRAFKDDAGMEPGSAPFTLASPAELSTNLVEVASVLCYILETPAATKTKRDSSTYHGINLAFNQAAGGAPANYTSLPIEINVLTTLDVFASTIDFDRSVLPQNVDASTVECRAYKDTYGAEPGSEPFTLDSSAALSTNVVEVASVLCYITETQATITKAKRESTYCGINLNFVTSAPSNNPTYDSEPIELNVLTAFDISASAIEFDHGVSASNVDLSTVECRAFKDDAGVNPASEPFTLTQNANLSTNLVEVASVLCYVVESS